MIKNIVIVILLVTTVLFGGLWLANNSDSLGGFTDEYNQRVFHNTVDFDSGVKGPTRAISSAAVTLTSADFGKTIFLGNASGTTVTLPALTNGASFTFVIASAFADTNSIIDSAEGDNIEGALIVAGAVVDCDAVDQINFVADGENVGDYVEIYSNGTKWFIGDSGALTSAKLTCTDPS